MLQSLYQIEGDGEIQADGTASGPFRCSGQWGGYQDVETGLVLMGFRYYDPASGRFLTKDPIGFAGGINQYSYVTNNPVNLIDPIGLWGVQFGENGPNLGFGSPSFIFTAQNVGEGLGVGYSAVGSSFSFGLWDGGQAACDPTFQVSRALSNIGRDALMTAGGLKWLGGVAGAAKDTDRIITVSRWGREGLERGDWVMPGRANYWNWLRTGKWQKGFGNEFASFESGQEFLVRASSVKLPTGWSIDGWWKGFLFGQRIYMP